MKVEIITIGDEILIGQIVDTNSQWIAQLLTTEGFFVERITSISDEKEEIKASVKRALEKVDVVLLTGGIGPTKDDITKQTLCEIFDTELILDLQVLDNVIKITNSNQSVMNELNRQQAFVPKKSTVINNKMGTAPITWFDENEKVLVSMPGVPFEMKWAMTEEIIPRLRKKYQKEHILHRYFFVSGISESLLAIQLETWENSLPAHIKLAYLPSMGYIQLRLTAKSYLDISLLETELASFTQTLRTTLKDLIIYEENILIEEFIANLLKESGLSISTAESCTGGNIAKTLTSVPGSSAYFKGSIVAYHREVKEKILQIPTEYIDTHGLVSLSVVEKMAEASLRLFNTDISLATTGIAGPFSIEGEKEVGTVCIALASKNKTISKEFHFGVKRERNIVRSTIAALVMLKEFLRD